MSAEADANISTLSLLIALGLGYVQHETVAAETQVRNIDRHQLRTTQPASETEEEECSVTHSRENSRGTRVGYAGSNEDTDFI